MKANRLACRLASLLVPAMVAFPASAQLVSAGLGASASHSESTFRSYKFGFRQNIAGDWSYSVDYLNEGHLPNHHRDGYAATLSYESGLLGRYRTWLYAGVGPYYYFDTQTGANGQSLDIHGLAPALNLSARHRVSTNWDVLLSYDVVLPTRSIHAQTLTLQAAYWIGSESTALRSTPVSRVDAPASSAAVRRAQERAEPLGFLETPYVQDEGKSTSAGAVVSSEWAVFGAVSVINIAGNPRSDGGSAEYRLRMQTSHQRGYDLSIAYLYEGDPRLNRRHGVAAEFWPVRSDRHLNVDFSLGVGAYVFVDQPRSSSRSAAVAPIISTMISWAPPVSPVFYRVIWDRVVSNNNRDADIWRLGIGRTL